MAEKRELQTIISAKDHYSKVLTGAQKNYEKLKSVMGGVIKVGAGLGAAVAGISGALFALAKTTANTGDKFDKMSKRLNISSQALSEYEYAAKRSGASVENLEKGFAQLNRKIYEASTGSKLAIDSFKELGVSFKNSDGSLKNSAELLPQIADKLKNMDDEAARTATTMTLFGKSGLTLLPMLKEGSAGIEGLRKHARELGITFSDEAAAKSAEFQDQLLDMQSALTGVKNTIGIGLLPVFTELFKNSTKWILNNKTNLQDWVTDGIALVVDALDAGVQTARAFKNAWLGIKLVANTGISALATGTNELLNYFGVSSDVIKTMSESSKEVLLNNLKEIEESENKYISISEKLQSIKNTITDLRSGNLPSIEVKATPLPQDSIFTAFETQQTSMTEIFMSGLQTREDEYNLHADRMLANIERYNQMQTISERTQTFKSNALIDLKKSTHIAANKAMENQMLSFIETGKFSVGEFAKQMTQMVKIELVSLSARAAVNALYELALGYSMAGTPGLQYLAAWHFKSAATYGAISAGALAGAAALNVISGPSQPAAEETSTPPVETVSGESSTPQIQSASQSEAKQDVVIVKINTMISPENLDQIMDNHIVPSLNRGGKNRNIKLDANLIPRSRR